MQPKQLKIFGPHYDTLAEKYSTVRFAQTHAQDTT
jgi:hypothetical protein